MKQHTENNSVQSTLSSAQLALVTVLLITISNVLLILFTLAIVWVMEQHI
jgi:hypothetical protein